MIRRSAARAVTVGVLLSFVGSGGSARTMQQRLERVCAGPIDQLCAKARPDADKINACLASHHTELPPDCASLVDVAD